MSRNQIKIPNVNATVDVNENKGPSKMGNMFMKKVKILEGPSPVVVSSPMTAKKPEMKSMLKANPFSKVKDKIATSSQISEGSSNLGKDKDEKKFKVAGMFASGPKVTKFPGPALSLQGASKMSADDTERSLMESDRRL
jgi:hypothetical protein